jgi:heme/copper-type cytochrome/quinol oxidase subunit 2
LLWATAGIGLLLLLSGCAPDATQDTLQPQGPYAQKLKDLFIPVFWVAVFVFIVVEGGIVWITIRYRHRKGRERMPAQIHGNTRLEIGWTIAPALILAGVMVPTVILIPTESAPIELYDVGASSPSNVWAVGRNTAGRLRYHFNGTSWSRFFTLDPSQQDQINLAGVDVKAPDDVWAVGHATQGSGTNAYIERYNTDCPLPTNTRTATRTGTATSTPTPNSYVVVPGRATIVPGVTDLGIHCNNCVAAIRLPFAARLYDRQFTEAIAGSNGTLGFRANSNPSANNCLPEAGFDYAVLPYWDDLDLRSPTACNGQCGVYTSISGTAPNRIFNIEWRATLVGGVRLVNFEVRLYESLNRIDLVYGSLDSLSTHTIGAQRDTGSAVTRIYCNGRLEPQAGPDREVEEGMMFSLVEPNVLVGHVEWQGAGTQPDSRQQQAMTLTLKLGDTEADYPVMTTDASGFFTVSVSGLLNGLYDWRVKGARHLATSGTVELTGAAQTHAEMGIQQVGDANGDNVVSTLDFNILRLTFGKAEGDPGYDPSADFNNDSVSNIADFNLLRMNFGLGGAPEVKPSGP